MGDSRKWGRQVTVKDKGGCETLYTLSSLTWSPCLEFDSDLQHESLLCWFPLILNTV